VFAVWFHCLDALLKEGDVLLAERVFQRHVEAVGVSTERNVDGVGFEQSIDMIAGCVDMIYSEEETWTSADSTKKEMVEFLEGLGSKQFKELEKFFTTMPKLTHEFIVTNPKTKVENTVKLEGLAAFFN